MNHDKTRGMELKVDLEGIANGTNDDELFFDPETGELRAGRRDDEENKDRLPATTMAREGFFCSVAAHVLPSAAGAKPTSPLPDVSTSPRGPFRLGDVPAQQEPADHPPLGRGHRRLPATHETENPGRVAMSHDGTREMESKVDLEGIANGTNGDELFLDPETGQLRAGRRDDEEKDCLPATTMAREGFFCSVAAHVLPSPVPDAAASPTSSSASVASRVQRQIALVEKARATVAG